MMIGNVSGTTSMPCTVLASCSHCSAGRSKRIRPCWLSSASSQQEMMEINNVASVFFSVRSIAVRCDRASFCGLLTHQYQTWVSSRSELMAA